MNKISTNVLILILTITILALSKNFYDLMFNYLIDDKLTLFFKHHKDLFSLLMTFFNPLIIISGGLIFIYMIFSICFIF